MEPLIPPAGSLLLMTSRFHFTLPGLFARNLDEMPIEDARGLLFEIVPRIGEDAEQIARICGCLPLALRLVGSALAEHPTLSPNEYARRLKEGKATLTRVDAVLDLSYILLKEEHQRFWRTLAVFPTSFDAPAAAAVWDMEVDLTQDVLEELIRYSLIEWEDNEGRYRLHDLARHFADQHLASDERTTAQKNQAKHFLGILDYSDSLFLGGSQRLYGLRIFDAERDNIQISQAWAAEHFMESEEISKICSSFPYFGNYVLEVRLLPSERVKWIEPALKAAQRLGDRVMEATHLANLGFAYENIGELLHASEVCEQALMIVREIGNRRLEANVLGILGDIYLPLGTPLRAIEFYEQAIEIAREIGNRLLEGRGLGSMGNAYGSLGDFRRAIEFYEQYLAIAREIGDRRGEGKVLGGLGVAYSALSDSRNAVEYYEQYLAIAREIGDRQGEAWASWNRGLQYKEDGDLGCAVDLMQIRVDYEREIGHSNAEKHAADVEAIRTRLREQES